MYQNLGQTHRHLDHRQPRFHAHPHDELHVGSYIPENSGFKYDSEPFILISAIETRCGNEVLKARKADKSVEIKSLSATSTRMRETEKRLTAGNVTALALA